MTTFACRLVLPVGCPGSERPVQVVCGNEIVSLKSPDSMLKLLAAVPDDAVFVSDLGVVGREDVASMRLKWVCVLTAEEAWGIDPPVTRYSKLARQLIYEAINYHGDPRGALIEWGKNELSQLKKKTVYLQDGAAVASPDGALSVPAPVAFGFEDPPTTFAVDDMMSIAIYIYTVAWRLKAYNLWRDAPSVYASKV